MWNLQYTVKKMNILVGHYRTTKPHTLIKRYTFKEKLTKSHCYWLKIFNSHFIGFFFFFSLRRRKQKPENEMRTWPYTSLLEFIFKSKSTYFSKQFKLNNVKHKRELCIMPGVRVSPTMNKPSRYKPDATMNSHLPHSFLN